MTPIIKTYGYVRGVDIWGLYFFTPFLMLPPHPLGLCVVFACLSCMASNAQALTCSDVIPAEPILAVLSAMHHRADVVSMSLTFF